MTSRLPTSSGSCRRTCSSSSAFPVRYAQADTAMTRDVNTADDEAELADWQRRVVGRSLQDARRRSLDRSERFIRAAAKVLQRNNGASLTVQEVADEAGQSLRTLYQYFESKDELLLAV